MEMQGRFEGAAACGDGALETFDSESYDFVVCATGMTGVSGWEVADRLRQIDRARHLLMFTGYGSPTGLDGANEIGTISAGSVSDAQERLLRVPTSTSARHPHYPLRRQRKWSQHRRRAAKVS